MFRLLSNCLTTPLVKSRKSSWRVSRAVEMDRLKSSDEEEEDVAGWKASTWSEWIERGGGRKKAKRLHYSQRRYNLPKMTCKRLDPFFFKETCSSLRVVCRYRRPIPSDVDGSQPCGRHFFDDRISRFLPHTLRRRYLLAVGAILLSSSGLNNFALVFLECSMKPSRIDSTAVLFFFNAGVFFFFFFVLFLCRKNWKRARSFLSSYPISFRIDGVQPGTTIAVLHLHRFVEPG